MLQHSRGSHPEPPCSVQAALHTHHCALAPLVCLSFSHAPCARAGLLKSAHSAYRGCLMMRPTPRRQLSGVEHRARPLSKPPYITAAFPTLPPLNRKPFQPRCIPQQKRLLLVASGSASTSPAAAALPRRFRHSSRCCSNRHARMLAAWRGAVCWTPMESEEREERVEGAEAQCAASAAPAPTLVAAIAPPSSSILRPILPRVFAHHTAARRLCIVAADRAGRP